MIRPEKKVEKIQKADIITSFSSVWSFHTAIASKKDGKSKFCADHGTLNRKMKANRWPLPRKEEIFDYLKGSSALTTLHLFEGYLQVRMSEECN